MNRGIPGTYCDSEFTDGYLPGCASGQEPASDCRGDSRGAGRFAGLRLELRHTFRSFRHVNFRLYFAGQLVSLSGTWMQSLAQNWLVFRLTHSALMLGVVHFAALIPALVLGLFAGTVADRCDRRKILLVTQFLAMLQAAMFALLYFSGRIEVWQVVVLSVLLGSVNAFEMPARQAFIVSMVDRKDLVNAMSLNASLFHASRTAGPAIGGIVIALFGEGLCFALNALSYLAALVAILLIRLPAGRSGADSREGPMRIGAAIGFCLANRNVRSVLLLASASSLFGMQYLVMMPVFASDVLGMQSGALGALIAGAGVGALTAALVLANRATGELLERGVGLACLGFSIVLAFFSLSTNFYLSLALTLPLGFFITAQMSGSHSLLQLAVSDELRGRMSSLWMMNMLGLLPIGSLVIGLVASKCGAPASMLICAGACALSALAYLGRWRAASPANTARSG